MIQDERIKQENIILQLQMILDTTKNINETLCKTIDLVDGFHARDQLHTKIGESHKQLSEVLELLGLLSQETEEPTGKVQETDEVVTKEVEEEMPVIEDGQIVYQSS